MLRMVVPLACCMLATLGCSTGPQAVEPVDVDPSSAATQAMTLYDANGDGSLDDDELSAVPGIQSAKLFYDKDHDGKVSADEIVARLQLWNEQGLGFRPLTLFVLLDGKPLADVEVQLLPEPYLGDAVKPAAGKTMADGSTNVTVEQEDLPAALKTRRKRFYGVTGGTYKIKILSASQDLPPKFHSETTLGVEVALDTIKANHYLNLKSNEGLNNPLRVE